MLIFNKNEHFENIVSIFEMATKKTEFSKEKFTKCINSVLKIASEYKFMGDCYKNYIAWYLINDENPFTIDAEMKCGYDSSLKLFAMSDISLIREMFFLKNVSDDLKEMFYNLKHFKTEASKETNKSVIGKLSGVLAEKLSETEDDSDFLECLTEFYKTYGVGMFGLNKAFRINENVDGGFSLTPVSQFEDVHFSDLWGYEIQKEQLIQNTESFLNRLPANNVLLYGDSGTGKSTCVKALLNEYNNKGLRIIEVYKHQFKFLLPLLNILKNRNYFFIIYMDDLSFEDFEIEYKYLKAVIEGGMETNPDNVLIYATSNRRHLIKETWKDRADYDEDLHHSDTMQEKLSLSDRFGVAINFTKPVQKEYFEIIRHLAKKHEIALTDEELISLARAWGVQHGGYTGRAAKQLIKHLSAK